MEKEEIIKLFMDAISSSEHFAVFFRNYPRTSVEDFTRMLLAEYCSFDTTGITLTPVLAFRIVNAVMADPRCAIQETVHKILAEEKETKPTGNLPGPQLYSLEFSDELWEEIESLSVEGLQFERNKPMSRPQWCSLGFIALGKASQLRKHAYDPGGGTPAEDDCWAEDLEAIAETIFNNFKSADGKI